MRTTVDKDELMGALQRVRENAVRAVARGQGLFTSSSHIPPFYIGERSHPDDETAALRIWKVLPSVELTVYRIQHLYVALRLGKALEEAGMPVIVRMGVTSDVVRKELDAMACLPTNHEKRRVLLDALPQIEAIEKEITQTEEERKQETDHRRKVGRSVCCAASGTGDDEACADAVEHNRPEPYRDRTDASNGDPCQSRGDILAENPDLADALLGAFGKTIEIVRAMADSLRVTLDEQADGAQSGDPCQVLRDILTDLTDANNEGPRQSREDTLCDLDVLTELQNAIAISAAIVQAMHVVRGSTPEVAAVVDELAATVAAAIDEAVQKITAATRVVADNLSG